MKAESETDYKSLYDGYWQASDRVGECSGDLARIASLVIETCGYGTAIDIGCGEGFMVAELLARGIDAVGLDVSAIVVERANKRWPGRIFHGSVLSLPFPEGHFDFVVSTDCMEHLAPADVPVALQEMHRVSSRYVFLQIATTNDRDGHWHLTVEGRAWWEARCFEAGFRKHALYYRANPYEALNKDGWQIVVLLEKVPADALQHFDLSVLLEERLLHTDMLREGGRRSDAHCIRYHKAAEFIRPGDRVLDVACGLGYGSHILYAASQARSVLGVDLSDFGVAYATAHYGHPGSVEFRVGDAQALDFIPDHSIDFVAAFETIEHVPDPLAYLREIKRVLKPAGRVMVCAPNNWVDETGKDPNPHHLGVYTWERLVAECGAHFLLEGGFLQTAGGAMKCHNSARKWAAVPVDHIPQEESEWVLVLAMADPVAGEGVPYEETAWMLPDSPEFHVSAFARDYTNPWLVKGMVAMGMRARSVQLLAAMHDRVLASADPESVDYGAALCGHAYGCMQVAEMPAGARERLEAEIHRYAAIQNPSPHQLRWQVSLLFVGGELARRQGRIDEASRYFLECASRNVAAYSPLLGNKVIDALYWLSVFALCRHEKMAARAYLLHAVQETQRFVSGSWLNISGHQEAPLPFGLAEAAQLLDKASRAAYMLSVLDGGEGRAGVVYQESTGFFERQLGDRDHRLSDLGDAVASLMSALAENERASHILAGEVVSQDARAQELAREVAKQDAHAQELAREVAKQDAHAQELAREVAKQDAHAQSLTREVGARDADAQRLAVDLVQSRAEVARLLEVVREQDAILKYFRPRSWPGVLRKILTKRRS
jgi:ubiquinone/menaquinone biosynthesis C-methylase UbiE